MGWKGEYKKLILMIAVFLVAYHLPIARREVPESVGAAPTLPTWYAQEHVLPWLLASPCT